MGWCLQLATESAHVNGHFLIMHVSVPIAICFGLVPAVRSRMRNHCSHECSQQHGMFLFSIWKILTCRMCCMIPNHDYHSTVCTAGRFTLAQAALATVLPTASATVTVVMTSYAMPLTPSSACVLKLSLLEAV